MDRVGPVDSTSISIVTVKTHRTRVGRDYNARHAIPGIGEFDVEPCRRDRLVDPAAGPIARPVSGSAGPAPAAENLPDPGIDYRPDPWHTRFTRWLESGAYRGSDGSRQTYRTRLIRATDRRAVYHLTATFGSGFPDLDYGYIEVRRARPVHHREVDWRALEPRYHGPVVYRFLDGTPHDIRGLRAIE